MRAILCARVSSKHLQSDGFSVETQLERMRMVAAQQDWTIVAEYTEYESAFEEGLSRTELNKLLDTLRGNGAEILLFFSSDRFTRDVADGVILRRELYRIGVQLFFCHPQLTEIRSENELVNILTDWQSQQYVEKLREASMRGYKAKIESGAYGQGSPPYGYRVEGEGREARLVIVEEHAVIVRWIFDWFVFDNLTSTQISHRLDELRIPTPGEVLGRARKRAVAVWDTSTVCKILRNEVYVGTWYGRHVKKVSKKRFVKRPREEWIAVACPPIVPRELWQEAKQRLEARTHKRNGRHDYLMARRLMCRCGYAIHASVRHVGTSHQRKYYSCCAYRTVKGKCGLPGVRADVLEPAVWQWICDLMNNPEALLEGYRAAREEQEKQNAHLHEQLAILSQEISEYEAKLTRLLDLYLDGGFPKDVLDVRKGEYTAILDRMRTQRKTLTEQVEKSVVSDADIISITTFVSTVKEQLGEIDNADFATKRQLVEALNLTGTLTVEDGVRVLYLHWCLRDFRLPLDAKNGQEEGPESGSISGAAGTQKPGRRWPRSVPPARDFALGRPDPAPIQGP
jgi:site-specific DNA recombinase